MLKDKKILVLGCGIIGFIFIFYLAFFIKPQIDEAFYGQQNENSKEEIKPFDSWVTVESKELGFSSSFPIQPVEASGVVTIEGSNQKAKNTVYTAQLPLRTQFSIRVMQYPKSYETGDVSRFLRRSMDDVMDAVSNSVLRNINDDTFLGNPSIDFSIQNFEIRIEATAFLVDHTVYLLVYQSLLENFEQKYYDNFKDSFKLTK